MKNYRIYLLHLIAILVAIGGFATVRAEETVFRTAFAQDFEDVSTYTNNFKEGSVASAVLGTTASDPKDITYTVHDGPVTIDKTNPNCQISHESRTTYTGESSHYLRAGAYGSRSINLMYKMPSEATSAQEYKIEFDYYLGPSFSNNSNAATNGLAIVGGKGILAHFGRTPVSSSTEYDVTIYRGDDPSDVISTAVTTGPRGSSNIAERWIHVTVRGDASGVYLTAKNADGKGLEETKLQDTFDVVESLYFRASAKNYQFYVSVDDLRIGLPAEGTSSYVWTNAAGDGLWSNAANWTVDGEVPLATPSSVDLVVIPENAGDVYIECDVAYKSLTLGEGSRLALLVKDVTETTPVFTIPSGLTADQIVVCGPYEKGVSEDGLSITAMRVPSVFTWAADGGTWRTAANWKVGDLPSGDVPGTEDVIIFEKTSAMTMDVTLSVSNVIVAANAKASISGEKNLCSRWFTGEGDLRLNGGNLGNIGNSVISNNIEVVEGTENVISVGHGGGYTTQLYGNLSGAGSLKVDENKQNSAGLEMYGDNSSFSGTFTVYNYYANAQRSNTRFHKAASSALASWTLRGNSRDNIFRESNHTYYFGALNGDVYEGSTYSGIILEVGARNEDCKFSGCLSRSDDSGHKNYGTKVRKVGTAKLTIDTINTGTVEINGGTLAFKQASALPHKNDYGDYWIQFGGGTLESTGLDVSALVQKSSGAISIDVGAEMSDTWATALDASNVGGLNKKGAGTLTLAAVPQYTGYTRVEAGKLIVPTDTELAWDISSPVTPADALEGAKLTAYGMGTVTDTWVYGVNSWNDVDNIVDLANLKTIDLTSVTKIAKGQSFVIMKAKAFYFNDKPMTKAQREAITVLLNDNVKDFAAARGYALRIQGQNLVYGPKTGFAIIVR